MWKQENTHLLFFFFALYFLYVETENGVFSMKKIIFSTVSVLCLFISSEDVITQVQQIKGSAQFAKYTETLTVGTCNKKAKNYKELKGRNEDAERPFNTRICLLD